KRLDQHAIRLVDPGMLALESFGDAGHVGKRLLASDARLQPSDGHEPAVLLSGLPKALRHEPDRREYVCRRVELKSRRQDANHRKACAVERELAPNDLSIAAEAALPESVSDDRRRRTVRLFVFRREVPAELWYHTERGKKVRGDQSRQQPFGLTAAGKVKIRSPCAGHFSEAVVPL